MIGISIDSWTWRSVAVLAAALDADGLIRRANPALERLGGSAGRPFADLIEPSQHAALQRRLATASDSWRSGTFGFASETGRPATDRRLWIAAAGDEVLVVGEPVVDEQERLVEKVLELNDELVGTHRELVRQRAAAEAGERRVAELLERERGIAETLQRALLPDRLPSVEGIELVAHFEPATGHVGGDWYDALELESGELALAIGDVAGKGIPAAALMGELRGGLRAAILAGAEPSDALRVLDRLAQRAGHMATVVIVLLDPATGALRYATAGHLPPALIDPGGAVRFLTAGASTPLIAYDPKAGGATDRLERGARLVLYTDGLVERRSEAIDASLRRLAEAASAGVELAALPAHLLAALRPPEGIARDDIAIVAVQRTR
ncbi:serine/threonine-protein phosphatase [Solirubrobacter ginsenosidimutans]|uniref:Serine/threonine-protein phosphatase n=1 Tax=Solirubrobacter ginsenosidimutans TaxID=490573 RepID=A0A9X3MQL8_9ACTN|nr:PP2C family protein-serine/threonine phosphatase [Solirubrobacter ginsenosidimutans]MDA0161136.1 serine/threonine-protein phosphatase [Solirubrobacter ginsenosidimutans]